MGFNIETKLPLHLISLNLFPIPKPVVRKLKVLGKSYYIVSFSYLLTLGNLSPLLKEYDYFDFDVLTT